MSDDTDDAVDHMVRQLGTHIIPDPRHLWQFQTDVTQLIAHDEVALAATLRDGSIILRCPNGLPEELAGVAEPYRPSAGAAKSPGFDSKLALIEQKLDCLIADGVEREQRQDRLDALEFALQERSHPQPDDGGPTTETLLQRLIDKHDALTSAISGTNRLEELSLAIARIEEGMNAALSAPAPGDHSHLVTEIGAMMTRLQDALAASNPSAAAFDALMAKVEDLASSPVSAPQQITEDKLQQFFASLESRFDWAPIASRLDALQAALATNPNEGVSEGLAMLSAKVSNLSERPDPVLDLTHQRQSFAAFATAFSRALQRLESVSETIETQLDAATSPPLDESRGQLDRMEAQVASLAKMIRQVADSTAALHHRADPVLDLTPQRQSFAAFAQALATVVSRLEGVSGSLEGMQSQSQTAPQLLERLDRLESGLVTNAQVENNNHDLLVKALQQMSDQVRQIGPQSMDKADQHAALLKAAQDELLQDLRFAFAEVIAVQLRAQGLAA